MKRFVLLLTILAISAVGHAQAPSANPPVTAVTFVISGGVSPITNTLPISSMTGPVTCPTAPGTVQNPTSFTYQANATDTTCWKYTDPGNGPLISLPVGGTTYTATLAFVNSVGTGPVSNVSNPFNRPGAAPQTAPVGLSVH